MSKLITTRNSILELLYLAIFLFPTASPAFAQDSQNKAVLSVTNAKVEGRFLEAADGSIRVVKKLTAVDGQYLECSGEGPKSLGPLEQFKGPASCTGTPPGVEPGQFSFEFRMTVRDSLIIHVQPGKPLNARKIELKDGGLLNVPGSIMATKHGKDQLILKVNS